MTENKSILLGGLAILVGVPVILATAWVLWTYPLTNVLVYAVLFYLFKEYDSTLTDTRWWTLIAFVIILSVIFFFQPPPDF